VTIFAEMQRLLVAEKGWRVGTALENQVALILSRFRDRPEQQYSIGKYRVDFAWPEQKIVLEADGWYHRSPDGAGRDRQRDSWLRSQGWLIFRVDDEHGPELLEEQVVRVSRVVMSERSQRARLGGLTRAALAPTRQSITEGARAGRWERYRDKVREAMPDLTEEVEIDRRAELLRKADMQRMSMKAAAARRARQAGTP
jgi:very-short-patch-repair endonuclease